VTEGEREKWAMEGERDKGGKRGALIVRERE
jgi:hypothetical protein